MINYASISETIAKKLYNAELKLSNIEDVINKQTSPTINKLEKSYINGENVEELLNKAYNEHDKACMEYDKYETIYNAYKEAEELYKRVCKLIEYANDVEIYGL